MSASPSHRRTWRSHGLTFEVTAGSAPLLQAVEQFLPPGVVASSATTARGRFAVHRAGTCDCGEEHRQFEVTRGRTRVGCAEHVTDALVLLRAEIKMWVAANSRRFVFVHAGVVGWAGTAVVIPGSTGTGKSTLVRALLRAGATYMSDDMAPVDVDGRVHPYPLPIGQRARHDHEMTRWRDAELDVSGLGVPLGTAPTSVGLVLFAPYRPSATWRPRPLSTGGGVLEALAHTVAARRQPEASMRTLAALSPACGFWKSERGGSDEVVEFVRARLGPAQEATGLIRTTSRS